MRCFVKGDMEGEDGAYQGGLPAYQDDHLKQNRQGQGLGGEGGWSPYSATSTTTKTSTRTYTAPDGTLVTEVLDN